MTPKEELIYRIIVQEGPITYTGVMKFLQYSGNGDSMKFNNLMREGFITQKKVCKTGRNAIYKATKKVKA